MRKEIAAICLLFIAVTGCLAGGEQEGAEENLLEKVDRIASGNELFQEYVLGQGFSKQVEELSIEQVLEKKHESIYSDLPEKELVEVIYSHSEKGIFVAVIDLEEEKVVKFYRTISILG